MSLKHFHLFFIATCVSLMAFLAHWSRGGHPGLLLVSLAGLAACLGYFKWFIQKYGKLR
jgi:hypothetical protein